MNAFGDGADAGKTQAGDFSFAGDECRCAEGGTVVRLRATRMGV
jgi:hypothetical protein